MYKFKITKTTTEESEIEVKFGTYYFLNGGRYFRIVISPRTNNLPCVDIMRVIHDKGIDTKIVFNEDEFELPYEFSMFLANQGPGQVISSEQFNKIYLKAITYLNKRVLD